MHAIAKALEINGRKVNRRRKRYAEGGLATITKDRPRDRSHGGKY